MILMDIYQKGVGVIQKLPSVSSIEEAEKVLQDYCKEHGLHVVGKEHCPLDGAFWNYLSNGTELDYCKEPEP